MNRILLSIDKMEKQINSRIVEGLISKQNVEDQSRLLDLSTEEHAIFQNQKSLAQQSGVLTLDEANTVYQLLGGTNTVFNKQPVHVKYVLTKLLSELIS